MDPVPERYAVLLRQYEDEIEKIPVLDRLAAARLLYLAEAERLHSLTGQRRPPFDPLRALPLRGIHVHRWTENMPSTAVAQLRPDDLGFTLLLKTDRHINPNRPSSSHRPRETDPRLRLTIAHE